MIKGVATEVMRADAGLHADPTRRQIGEPGLYLARADRRSHRQKKSPKLISVNAGQAERQIVECRRRCRPIRGKKRKKW